MLNPQQVTSNNKKLFSMKIKENKSFFDSQLLPNLNNRPMTISLQPIKSTLSDQTPLMSSTPN